MFDLQQCKVCSVLVFIFIFKIIISTTSAEPELKSNMIYRLRNRHDNTFLTAINLKIQNPPIVADEFREAATQKWRLTEEKSPSYDLRPTSDETKVMSVDSREPELVSQDTIRWYFKLGLSNSHFWEIRPMGENYSQLKNYKTGECLHNFGKGRQVGIAPCDNSYRQQWEMQLL